MKLEMVNAVKNTVVNMVSPKKAEKAASVAIKDGERMIANGQDAAAAQGKAMLKPYVKPEMEVVEIKKSNLKAASDIGERDMEAREFDFEDGYDW